MAESQTDRAAARLCDLHGEYQPERYRPGCPQCNAQRDAARQADEALRQAREQAERHAERLARRLRLSGIKRRFEQAGFDNFETHTQAQRDVLAACRQFAETFDPAGGGGLWLIGPPGTGKTHLGAAMVNHAIRQRDMAAAIHGTHELMAMLRARWGAKPAQWSSDGVDSEAELMDYLSRVPLLVLDEVGIGRGSDHEMRDLFAIVDARYCERRPTVLASNLRPDAIKAAVGNRTYDRLRDGARMLVMDWPSRRGGH